MTTKTIVEISTKDIIPGDNDRTIFTASELSDLASSIKEHGLIQPITVRALDIDSPDQMYEIVAGERRFRACKLLGWDAIPAIVADITDEEASAVMLSENIARQELDPIDEAGAYQKRMTQFGWTVSECADKAGVSEIRVQFRIKLLRLRSDVQQLVRTGNIGIGYAQILADSGLDANFQTQAIVALRDNPRPVPGWFRKVCGDLLRKQAQTSMFSEPLFVAVPGVASEPERIIDPPHPSTSKPPMIGKTPREIVQNQAAFWNTAASAWAEIGKPFKRQECEAAAQALQLVLVSF